MTNSATATTNWEPASVAADSTPTRFDYGVARVSDIQIHSVSRSQKGRLTLDQLEIDGRPVKASWTANV